MQLKPIPTPKSQDYKVSPLKTAKIHSEFIGGMAIWEDRVLSSSEDGKMMFTRSGNLSGKQRLLNLGTAINHLSFSDDYSLLATASDDNMIRIFETETWKLKLEFVAHDSYVTKVAFANEYLISISHDATIKVWEHETGTLIHTLTGHEHWVYTMAVSPNGKQLITTSNNCSVKVWDIASGQEIKHLVDASSLVYASDGISLMFGGSNKTGFGNKDFPNASIWPTDEYAYTCGRDIVCWNTKDWSIKWQIDLSYDAIRSIVHLPQFNLLIAVSDSIYGINPDTGEIEFSHKNVAAVPIYSCAVIGDDWLATGDEKGNISIWAIDEFVSGGKSVAFGGDTHKPMYIKSANRIIAGSWLGGEASIWSKNGQLVATFRGFPSGRDNYAMTALPTEPHKVLMTGEGTLRIIDVRQAKIDATITLDMPDITVTEAIWINDEECLLSSVSREPRLLNIKTQEVKVVPSNYSLGGENYRLDDTLLLFQLGYYKDDSSRGENVAETAFSLKVAPGKDPELLEKQAPLIVFNSKTKEIVEEWWFPLGKAKSSYSTSYAWPIVGGPNNSITAASYLDNKKIYLWELGKEEPRKVLNMSKYAPGKYDNVYAVYANETHFFFRASNDLLLRYDIQKNKWTEIEMSGYKYTIDKERGLIAAIDYSNKIYIWSIDPWELLLEKKMDDKMEWTLFGDYFYIYSKINGMSVFELDIE